MASGKILSLVRPKSIVSGLAVPISMVVSTFLSILLMQIGASKRTLGCVFLFWYFKCHLLSPYSIEDPVESVTFFRVPFGVYC